MHDLAASLLFASLGFAFPVLAQQTFRCTDAEGRVTYQQAPCPSSATERKVDTTPANPDYDPAQRERVLKQGEEAQRRLEERVAQEETERKRRQEEREKEERLEREKLAQEAAREAPVVYYRPAGRPLPPAVSRPQPKPLPAPAPR